MATATKNTPATTTPAVSGKVRTIKLAKRAGALGGMTLNTSVLSAKAFGTEFWAEMLKPLSAEEQAQL